MTRRKNNTKKKEGKDNVEHNCFFHSVGLFGALDNDIFFAHRSSFFFGDLGSNID